MPFRNLNSLRASQRGEGSPAAATLLAGAVRFQALAQRRASLACAVGAAGTGDGSDSLDNLRSALILAEQQLCSIRRANESLQTDNKGLLRSLAEASRRGAEARRLAHHDCLTGLPNRLLLQARLREAIGEAEKHQRRFAVLFIDLDGFKTVNDRYGHLAGDKVLSITAARIMAAVRVNDVAYRYGGDEFVVLLSDVNDGNTAAQIAIDIRRRVGQRYAVGAHECAVSASIGIAIYPMDGHSVEALLTSADAAMYRNKTESCPTSENRCELQG
jgi:diguanylate cyclase (GGDEF)-like protein